MNEIMLLAEKWMELETIMLSKISQIQKVKYHTFFSFVKYSSNIYNWHEFEGTYFGSQQGRGG
jgi:hypothetical protein